MFERPSDTIRSVVCLAFRLIPRRRRYLAAARFARLVRPLVKRTRAYAARCELRTDGLPETSLSLILDELTKRGVTYDPIVVIDGIDHMPRPGDDHPCLLLGAHMMLSVMLPRVLLDAGVELAGITTDEGMLIPGTRRQMAKTLVSPSPMLLFQVRSCLRQRITVAAFIDRKLSEIDRRTSQVDTSSGTMVVTTPMIRIAAREKARIVFFGSRLRDDDAIVLTFRPATSSTAEGVAEEMAVFVDQLVNATATSRTSRPRHSSDRTTAIRG